MVSLATDNPSTQQFVAEFNQSLAKAKTDALALLRRLVVEGLRSAGSPEPSLQAVPPAGGGRESRLAASQILRTPFLRINNNGETCNDTRRARATPFLSGSDPAPDQNPSASPAALRETIPVLIHSRGTPDMGLSPPCPTHGTPDPIPNPQNPRSRSRCGGPEPQDPCVASVTEFTRRGGCEHSSSPRAPT